MPALGLIQMQTFFDFAIGISAGRQQFVEVAPVHADEVQRSAGTVGGEVAACLSEKAGEFGLVHLARSHRERAMVDRAEAARVPVDRHVVGRIGEDHRSALIAHQRCEGLPVEGVAAQDAMLAEKQQIADLADLRPRRDLGQDVGRVVLLGGLVFERVYPQVDLAHLEAGHLEAEIEAEQREVLELLGQQAVVPRGDLGQPVVGDHERAGLGRAQVFEAQRRHLGPAEFAGGQEPAMPANHVAMAVNQDRDIKTENLDALGNLPDLLFAV